MRRHAKAIVAISAMLLTLALGATVAGADAPAEAISLPAGPSTETTGIIGGWVDPNGSPTTYWVEYADNEAFTGAISVPASQDANAGSGEDQVSVSRLVTGLSPGSEYFYRVVAHSAAEDDTSDPQSFTTLAPEPPQSCPNEGLRTGLSAGLPECRAYERVSPAERNGFPVFSLLTSTASTDGNRVAFALPGALPGDTYGAFQNPVLGIRSEGGWISDSMNRPLPNLDAQRKNSTEYLSPDGSLSVVKSFSKATPDAREGAANLYLRSRDGSYELLNRGAPADFENSPYPRAAGFSADSSHFVYTNYREQDPPGAPGIAPNAYEWVAGQGTRLVGILPNGAPAPHGSIIGSNEYAGSVLHAISADGSRVFFHSLDPADETFSSSITGQLYVRDNGGTEPDTSDDTTIHISASQRTDCAGDPTCGGDGIADSAPDPDGPLPAYYYTAEADHGRRALFSSCEKLTDDSTAHLDANETCPRFEGSSIGTGEQSELFSGRDLYRYDVETGTLEDLTTTDPQGAELIGLVGASDDLQRIYFVARGDLASGASRGAVNLYLWDHGTVSFIGNLDGRERFSDEPDPAPYDLYNWVTSGGTRSGAALTTRVTPDGRHLVITSRQRLTAYDNASPSCARERCAEAYLFDADAHRFSCVSCPEDNAPSDGDAQLFDLHGGSAFTGFAGAPLPGNLNAAGDRVYFESSQSLSGADTNSSVDVYQWHDGHRTLISNGSLITDSHFSDATSSGSDVFFLTEDRLIGADHDAIADLYDARVNGGFSEIAQADPCVGEACRGPASSIPGSPIPSTSAFTGPGNPEAKKPRRHRKHHKRRSHKKARSNHAHSHKQRRAGR